MSALYPAFLGQLLVAGINLSTADIRAALIDQADEVYNAADVFVSDVTAAGIVARSASLTSKTTTNGVFDAADLSITGVTGDSVEAVILYVYNAADTAARLIGYFDGLNLVPNGGAVNIVWPAQGIFAL